MQQLVDAHWLWKTKHDESGMRKVLHPIESMFDDLPVIVVKDGAAAALSNGAPLMRPGIVSIPEDLGTGSEVLITTIKGEAVALAKLSEPCKVIPSMTKGQVAQPHTVLMREDTYPRSWKK
jgi:predicted RNA-binding protein (TIGR00451 family)